MFIKIPVKSSNFNIEELQQQSNKIYKEEYIKQQKASCLLNHSGYNLHKAQNLIRPPKVDKLQRIDDYVQFSFQSPTKNQQYQVQRLFQQSKSPARKAPGCKHDSRLSIKVNDNGVSQHDIYETNNAIKYSKFAGSTSNTQIREQYQKILNMQRTVQEELHKMFGVQVFGIGGLSVVEVRNRFLTKQQLQQAGKRQTKYPFEHLRGWVTNLLKQVHRARKIKVEEIMKRIWLPYQPLSLDTHWPQPLSAIASKYGLIGQYELPQFLPKSTKTTDNQIIDKMKKELDHYINGIFEFQIQKLAFTLHKEGQLDCTRMVDQQIIQFVNNAKHYPTPSILNPEGFYDCNMCMRQHTHTQIQDIDRYLSKIINIVFEDRKELDIFVHKPDIKLFDIHLVQLFMQSDQIKNFALLFNQLLEDCFIKPFISFSCSLQRFPQQDMSIQQVIDMQLQVLHTQNVSNTTCYFDGLDDILELASNKQLFRQISQAADQILYNNYSENRQNSNFRASSDNLQKNLAHQMAQIKSNKQSQQFFMNETTIDYLKVHNATVMDTNHWAHQSPQQLYQQLSDQFNRNEDNQTEKIIKTPERQKSAIQEISTCYNTTQRKSHSQYQLSPLKLNTADLNIELKKDVSADLVNLTFPLCIFICRVVAVKTAEELYPIAINCPIGKQLIQKWEQTLEMIINNGKFYFQAVKDWQ